MTETLDHTVLGRWRLSPISFVEECLCDPETSEPFVLLDAERAFLEHAFKARCRWPAALSRADLQLP